MMKIYPLIILILICMSSGFSQSKIDYSGEWTLDFPHSSVSDKTPFPALSKTVTQNADNIEILNDAVIGRVFPDNQIKPLVYALNGEPRTMTFNSGINQIEIASQASFNADGDLEIVMRQRTVQSGQTQSKSVLSECWHLSSEAKALTITTTVKSIDQEETWTLVYTKSGLSPSQQNGIVNGRAIRLVAPSLSPEARKAKVQGNIVVKVLIDEKGYVVLAKTIGGDTTMTAAAEQAARLCRFSPTKSKGVSVSVVGIIIYTIARE